MRSRRVLLTALLALAAGSTCPAQITLRHRITITDPAASPNSGIAHTKCVSPGFARIEFADEEEAERESGWRRRIGRGRTQPLNGCFVGSDHGFSARGWLVAGGCCSQRYWRAAKRLREVLGGF